MKTLFKKQSLFNKDAVWSQQFKKINDEEKAEF